MVYDLPVDEEKIKPHHITTLHMVCSLAFIVAGAIIVVYNYAIPLWGAVILIAGLSLVAATMFKNAWVISNKVNTTLRVIELIMALCIAAYSVSQHWKFPIIIFSVLSAALVFALYWERSVGSTLFVHIDNDGIQLPVARKSFKPWTEIEQVILRYGILTIECVGNTMFQWSIPDTNVDNEIFEAYCSSQVEENRSKRRNDDW